MTSGDNEHLLVLLAQNGDVAAFEQLLKGIYAPTLKYVRGLMGADDAEDVLQETALRVYRQLAWLREPRAFRAWVYRIATRIAFRQLKRQKRWRAAETEFGSSGEAVARIAEIDMEQEMSDLLPRVSPASRAALLLHYQQNLSLEETAAILDIPVGTAKSRVAYGIAQLRQFVKEKQTR
ncbi:MAG TPA: sigma-70 family RNA polymerase sigma factor [Bryobacteraceae bacterium]|jgi:RNA polymerase sigma-70 factor (ECF subfamily)|nr:sigma-70 family RNA polymerase sigma factor [Bryobacteraceae bacterium]